MPKAHIVILKNAIDISPGIVDTLRSNDCLVEVSLDADGTVKTAQGKNPDLVIAGDSGGPSCALDAALSLRDRCHAPILWLSSAVGDEERARAALVPHFSVLSPPCTTSALMYAVDTALGNWRRERDIARKADLHRLIVESASSVILNMDTSGRILYLNDFGLKFFDFSWSDIDGKNVIGTIVPPVDTAGRDLAAMIAGIGRNPDRYMKNENENMRSDGSKVYIAWTNRAIHDENGNLASILCIGNDITARKKAEDALERSLEEKSTLLKELQHRVKNNLTILSMLLSMEARNMDDERAKHVFNEIINRIKTMATLYEGLYSSDNFSNLELDRYLSQLARALFETLMPDSRNIRLVTEMQPAPIDLKRAAPIGLILNELITNAAKYAFTGRGVGTISVNLDVKDGRAILTIADDGNGLPEGFSLERSAGTGLTLVKTLSRQTGGDFSMESGDGTTARLSIPLRNPE